MRDIKIQLEILSGKILIMTTFSIRIYLERNSDNSDAATKVTPSNKDEVSSSLRSYRARKLHPRASSIPDDYSSVSELALSVTWKSKNVIKIVEKFV